MKEAWGQVKTVCKDSKTEERGSKETAWYKCTSKDSYILLYVNA